MYAASTGEPFGERWRWVRGWHVCRPYGVKMNGMYWQACGPGMPGPYRVAESKVGDVDEVDGDIFNIGGELLWKALAICSLL